MEPERTAVGQVVARKHGSHRVKRDLMKVSGGETMVMVVCVELCVKGSLFSSFLT